MYGTGGTAMVKKPPKRADQPPPHKTQITISHRLWEMLKSERGKTLPEQQMIFAAGGWVFLFRLSPFQQRQAIQHYLQWSETGEVPGQSDNADTQGNRLAGMQEADVNRLMGEFREWLASRQRG